jgi:3-phosphoshikimate 1-carboxyvinyltransferase
MLRMDEREMQPCRRFEGTVRPPGSKSLTNRALVLAALANGTSHLVGALKSEDTDLLVKAIHDLGIDVREEAAPDARHPTPDDCVRRTLVVTGCNGRIPAPVANLNVGNSGTSMRFLCALAALGHGRFRLDGSARMRERPIADLIDALTRLGVRARCESDNGCPPVIVDADGLAGGATRVSGTVSSQFLSGLLMAAPYAAGPVEVQVEGTLISRPYAAMTLAAMRAFGARVDEPAPDRFVIDPQSRYVGRRYEIEPDASNAAYFLAAAAITDGRCRVEGVGRHSLQGDARFVEILEGMGARVRQGPDWTEVHGAHLMSLDADLSDMPDQAQTMAALAVFAEGQTIIRNVASLRVKETDRLRALSTELRRLGQRVEERADGLTITPRPVRPARVETYNDHRMAMSLALIGLKAPGVVIRDPGCVAKTFPEFFEYLDRLCR